MCVLQVSKAKFNDDPYLQAFGITVASHMVDVQGRILPVPKLQYGGRVSLSVCCVGVCHWDLTLPLIGGGINTLREGRVNTSLFRLVQTRRTCIDVPHTAAWGAAPASD